MSEINIHIRLDSGDTLEGALAKLSVGPRVRGDSTSAIAITSPLGAEDNEPKHDECAPEEKSAETAAAETSTAADTPPASDRPIGQPGPGRKRRTAAEVEEDRLRMAAAASSDSMTTLMPTNDTPAISTGEPRTNPEDVAQDEADEAAESAANKTKLTRDDIRRAVKRYSDAFGIPAAVKDVAGIIGGALGEVPDTQESIADAIARIDAAIAAKLVEEKKPANPTPAASAAVTNSASPEIATAGATATASSAEMAPATATKGDVIKAMLGYGKKYDGAENPEQFKHANADLTALFTSTLGAGVTGMKSMEQTPENLGRIAAAINAAIRDNPFNRAVLA